jgi:MAF protein
MAVRQVSPRIALASASPRRRELLELAGWEFSVCSTPVSETPLAGEAPQQVARRLALLKARAAKAACPVEVVTLAADTIVVHRGDILGKPSDAADAGAMLRRLGGQDHLVMTAVALDCDRKSPLVELCETRVPMRAYSKAEVAAYIEGGSPFDKAGAYGIQDHEFDPVDMKDFTGCFANVMGLPLCHVVWAFRQLGYEPPEDVPQRCKQFTGYDCTIYPTILRSCL